MVTGLQIDIPSDELKKLMEERLAHCNEKQTVYEQEAKTLRASVQKLEGDLKVGKGGGFNPAETLEQNATKYRELAAWYKFMLEHVIKNETYRLSTEDLRLLGITARDRY
jgi:type IV secretory pathway VirB4 component